MSSASPGGRSAVPGDNPDPDGQDPPMHHAGPQPAQAERPAAAVQAVPVRGGNPPGPSAARPARAAEGPGGPLPGTPGDPASPGGPLPGTPGDPASPGGRPPGTARDLSPDPGAAPLRRMVTAQALFDGRGLLRNGEQFLLTMIIPVLLLTGFSEASVLNLGHGSRVDFLTPGIIALAVMSTAFASQAIATGFERRYGVLKRLGATPLSRGGLVAARTVTMLAIEILQLAVIGAVATLLGWRPHGGWGAVLAVPLLVLVGTAAFSGLGLLMAGTLRAEATLAAANLVYLMLLGLGGVMFPLSKFPAGMRGVLELLPISALSGGLRSVLQHGTGLPWRDLAILAVWAIIGVTLAARAFRWD
jgi:ABC-2 type transport system permease protein